MIIPRRIKHRTRAQHGYTQNSPSAHAGESQETNSGPQSVKSTDMRAFASAGPTENGQGSFAATVTIALEATGYWVAWCRSERKPVNDMRWGYFAAALDARLHDSQIHRPEPKKIPEGWQPSFESVLFGYPVAIPYSFAEDER